MPRPSGRITRGTTGVNRLRRVDRWIAAQAAARIPGALVIDLGFGASATTTLELHARLAAANPGIEVLGLEIDPSRVALARRQLADARTADPARRGRSALPHARVSFDVGGFELPASRSPHLVRAMNVLRQYDEAEVAEQWRRMRARLAPGGILVEGTANEIGRVCSWVTLSAAGPETCTIALKLDALGTAAMPAPSVAAERLPKALIHRNVPGEGVYELLRALDAAWASHAALSAFGPTHRWLETLRSLQAAGWPLLHTESRGRLGECTVRWSAVAPRDWTG